LLYLPPLLLGCGAMAAAVTPRRPPVLLPSGTDKPRLR
jgi:hypothetical protein